MPVYVLVADDEEDIQILIQQAFRSEIRQGEYSFLFAQNAQQAIDLYSSRDDIEIVLTDINMPGMNGLEMIQVLKGTNPDVLPIVVSAYDDMANIRTAMNNGAFDFITKPVEMDTLRATMSRTLQIYRTLRKNRMLEEGYKQELEREVRERTAELEEINRTLETRVHEETEKRRSHEQMLLQQSRMAAMGEMVATIAHQWRQPLNTLGMTLQDMKEAARFGELDKEYIFRSVSEGMQQIHFMSHTVDDFRDFLRPGKMPVAFSAVEAVLSVLNILHGSLAYYGIQSEVVCDTAESRNTISLHPGSRLICGKYTTRSSGGCVNCDFYVMGYANEFKHVIMNIVNNAKDAILERFGKHKETVKGTISIFVEKRGGYISISIRDNGGGIPEDVLRNMFAPYFTTKPDDVGTGLGLYMAKTIVEQNMQGSLVAQNIDDGAEFTVSLKKAEMIH